MKDLVLTHRSARSNVINARDVEGTARLKATKHTLCGRRTEKTNQLATPFPPTSLNRFATSLCFFPCIPEFFCWMVMLHVVVFARARYRWSGEAHGPTYGYGSI